MSPSSLTQSPPDVPDGMVEAILHLIGDGEQQFRASYARTAVRLGAMRWRRETADTAIPPDQFRWYHPGSKHAARCYTAAARDEAAARGRAEADAIVAALPVLPEQATRSVYREALLDALTAPKAVAS